MSNPSPPRVSPWVLGLCALALFFGGFFTGGLFHENADYRQYIHSDTKGSDPIACADLAAYVEHVSNVQDHRIHATTFGIHRQKTIDAVTELLDRARCGAKKDAAGHETYTPYTAVVESDINDPAPPAQASPRSADNPDARSAAKPPVLLHPSRRRVVIVNDGTLVEALPPVASPRQPLDCGPPGINYGVPGCTYPRR